MLISICVCTYNRSHILAYCLHSLEQLIDLRPTHHVEIIVVDNNSSDETSALVKDLIPNFPLEMRYIFEPQQGISAARNRAIDEAKGDYLAFLDDECTVDRDWLSIAISDIETFQPCIIGGPYVGGFLPGDRPRWFKIEYGDAYFLELEYEKGFQDKFRASSGNMFVRRDVFDSVRFDVDMGPKGNKLKVGEETDLQERFLRAHSHERVFYEPAITVRHLIRPERLRLSYRAKRIFANTIAGPTTTSRWQLLIGLGKAIVHLTIAPVRCILRDREKYPFWQNFVYERVLPPTCSHLAMIVKSFRY
jgi:glycosyltransferase involved in cell wall biosynthesis